MKNVTLIISILLFQFSYLSYSQENNLFPSNTSVWLDGKSIGISKPNESGGWARGIFYCDSDNINDYTKNIAGIGLLGTGENVHRLYFGFNKATGEVNDSWNSKLGMYINKQGFVGVGITNPRTIFHVASRDGAYNVLSDGNSITFEAASNHTSYINKKDNGSISFRMGQTLTPTLIISGNKNVGVGRVPGNYKLDVNNNFRVIANKEEFIFDAPNLVYKVKAEGGWARDIKFGNTNSQGEQKYVAFGGLGRGSTNSIDYAYVDATGNPVHNNSKQLRIYPNGNVSVFDGNLGIGTTNMSDSTGDYRLSVKGKVRADEVKVYTGWSDFVFEKDYNLPTLKEVEKHIKEKGHLKDIPNAKEVEENGIYLGEINAKLLQKIEELTLYTIQQEKDNQELKCNFEALKSINRKQEESNEVLKERLEKLEKLVNRLINQ